MWKGFLTIAESALQVSFRSDYLKLYQSQQVAMAELLFAKEQLSEVRGWAEGGGGGDRG